MGRIHERGSVVSWLGPDGRDIQHFVSWVDAYFPEKSTPGTTSVKNLGARLAGRCQWRLVDAASHVSASHRRKRLLSLCRANKGYTDVMSAGYWRRMWTFQEWWVAPEAPRLVSGRYSFAVEQSFTLEPIDALAGLIKSEQKALAAKLNKAVVRDDAICFLSVEKSRRQCLERLGNLHENTTVLDPSMRDHAPDQSLCALLILTNSRDCKDPRDRVYALYGMVPAAAAASPANYYKSFVSSLDSTY